ncbi:flagellar protein FlaG [Uliginosibacterium paludis]|uniref:Flagellar protein FlaG n=1 Tax=Uliginosibacterium paludis TaxID=1615952 RepID=A0ABV2CK22_9RHOO
MAITSISGLIPAAYPATTAATGQTGRVAPAKPLPATSQASATESPAESTLQPSGLPSKEQIDQAMAQVKGALPAVAQNLQFSLDEDTGRTVVKVVDSGTNEVIRQIPSEELLAISKALDMFSGLLLKQKA